MATPRIETQQHTLTSLNGQLMTAYSRLSGHADGRDVAEARKRLRTLGMRVRDFEGDAPELVKLSGEVSDFVAKANAIFIFDEPIPAPDDDSAPADPAPAPEPDNPAPQPEPDEVTNDQLLAAIRENALPPEIREVLQGFTADDLERALRGGLAYANGRQHDDSSPLSQRMAHAKQALAKWYHDRQLPPPPQRVDNAPSNPNH